jgi:hypothetical protein
MTTIRKYALKADRITEVLVHYGSKPLFVGIEGPTLYVSVLCDTDAPVVKYRFYILLANESFEALLNQYGPEREVPENLKYIGTTIDNDTGLVYYTFYSAVRLDH